ncbi:MAG: hypothetical protein LCH59_05175 [Proteobacteria bacterium]|nr:hypothetical protein [Pseudomonadota bacterium]HRF83065.1 hypothetical protein [Pseudoxanthomonas sp.]
MPDLVKLATARELVDAGAVTQAEVIGQPGGWAVQLQTHNQARVLATKGNEPRRFGTFESALKVLRELGVRLDMLRVDAARWDAPSAAGTRQRPDRSAAMKQKDADARYAALLREGVLEARADTRSALSSAEARRHMDAIKAAQRARLDAALQD